MNTKNQKPVLEGFKNRIDLLGDSKKALASLTGQELLEVIQALAEEIQPPVRTWNEETYKHVHGDTLETMLADEAAFNSEPSTLNR